MPINLFIASGFSTSTRVNNEVEAPMLHLLTNQTKSFPILRRIKCELKTQKVAGARKHDLELSEGLRRYQPNHRGDSWVIQDGCHVSACQHKPIRWSI